MKYIYLSLVLIILLIQPAFSQLKINEIQTANAKTILDEDGDNEDWIEIINTGSTALNLEGYGLSDDPSSPFKWVFPKIEIGPQQKMLLFASGKNRSSSVNHWESLVNATDQWKYKVGSSSISDSWRDLSFNDGLWSLGNGGIGYGDPNLNTVISGGSGTISLFMRKAFSVIDTSQIASMIFSIDYDDGFVAYINGVEIARNNLGSLIPAWNKYAFVEHEAKMPSGGKPDSFVFTANQVRQYLKEGTNVLAVQVHNQPTGTNDMTASPFLFVGMTTSGNTYSALPSWYVNQQNHLHTNFKIDSDGETIVLTSPANITLDSQFSGNLLPADCSMARIPDGSNSWCLTLPGTPDATNNLNGCFSGQISKPTFSLAPGMYQGTQTVSISCSEPNATIRYTLNGDAPSIMSPVYSNPVIIDTSKVLKAKAFNVQGKLPSPVATATYLINESTTLPVISLSMDSFDLWDWGQGIYVMGPNASTTSPYKGANFWMNWDRSGYIEYFNQNGDLQFSTACDLGIYGNYSRSKPQKSFVAKMRSWYGASSLNYQLFEQRNVNKFKSFVLRNAGSDWMYCHFIDEMMHDLMFKENIYATASKPVIAFLNGKYWGVYHLRERNDEDFLESITGIKADSIDEIKASSDNTVTNGTIEKYNQLIDYVNSVPSFANQASYDSIQKWINIDNHTTYFATEIYSGNDDFTGEWTNNIKLYYPRVNGGKWNYMLHDVDQGLLLTNRNSLDSTINPSAANDHSTILRRLLENTNYKQLFINRFADLLNTYFTPASMNAQISKYRDKISAEMPRAFNRWRPEMSYPADTSDWHNAIQDIRNFVNLRTSIVRSHIQQRFGLSNQVNLTLNVFPEGTGKIKINTIVPDTFPWTGVYFNGNPVTITAVPEPGYTFDYWEENNSYPAPYYIQSITRNFTTHDFLYAHFKTAPDITITELNYNSDSTKNPGNWIELKNYGSTAMNISGWKLKKVQTNQLYTIPNGTNLNAGQYIVFVEDTARFDAIHPGVSNRIGNIGFGFSNKSCELQLLNNVDNIIKTVHYADSLPWPDCADGYGRTLELLNDTLNPNLAASWQCGCMMGSPGSAPTPCIETIIFSEVNYNSLTIPATADAGDWVELKNIGSTQVNIGGWTFKDGDDTHTFLIPANTMINPNQHITLVGNWTLFNARFPQAGNKIGAFGFGLSGNSEAIRLFDQNGKIYFSMLYHDSGAWTDSADGQGYTLELKYNTANPNLGSSWFAGCPGGSPGHAYTPNCAISSIDDKPTVNPVSIYPNPVSEQLTIQLNIPDSRKTLFQLFDIEGRLLASVPLQNSITTIPVSSYQAGLYFYKIRKDNIITNTGKIIIQQ